jgi:hypothetical protein
VRALCRERSSVSVRASVGRGRRGRGSPRSQGSWAPRSQGSWGRGRRGRRGRGRRGRRGRGEIASAGDR